MLMSRKMRGKSDKKILKSKNHDFLDELFQNNGLNYTFDLIICVMFRKDSKKVKMQKIGFSTQSKCVTNYRYRQQNISYPHRYAYEEAGRQKNGIG